MKPFQLAPTLPRNVGVLHFVGIGGIGMSGIAEILHNMGYAVQGSDVAEGPNVDRLRAMGIKVMVGHKPENVEGAAALVKSTAVEMTNPEIVAARAAKIPVIRRSEMLRELTRLKISVAIAGTHGKTTTTSLVATVLDKAGLDPTIINGGILNAYGTNARLGAGDWMVVEADESDGTFIKIHASIAVITNIDPEHLDHWGDFDKLRAAFLEFLDNLPFYGFAVLCLDHPEVQALIPKVTDRRIITYGTSTQADMRAVNIRPDIHGTLFDIEVGGHAAGSPMTIADVRVPVPGIHNVRNALAAISVGREIGIPDAKVKTALAEFEGVKRRFTRTGEVNGVAIIDDYGHHPVEIAATLKAARLFADHNKGRVIAVVQPHRFTRVRDLFADFCRCVNDADYVFVSEIYTAGETPIDGISRETLVQGIADVGHKGVLPLASPEELPVKIAELMEPGDLVVCLGAGSITKWAYALPEQLEALVGNKKRA